MGNIGHSQGLDELVRMFEEIDDPDATLVITGSGVAEDEVRAQIRSDRVQMLGVVDDARLEQELSRATAGVVSQRSDIVEFNVPVEAHELHDARASRDRARAPGGGGVTDRHGKRTLAGSCPTEPASPRRCERCATRSCAAAPAQPPPTSPHARFSVEHFAEKLRARDLRRRPLIDGALAGTSPTRLAAARPTA